MAKKKYAIDGGHGLGTSGKETPDKEKEWAFNNEMVKAAIAELKTYKDVEVLRLDDPSGKRDVPLTERTNKANAWGADYLISYHNNASRNDGKYGDHTGTETFTQTGVKGKETLDLAKAVHKGMVRAFGLKDRGLKTANYAITRQSNMPACLTEGAFMDSRIDIKKLRDKKVLKEAGKQSIIEVAKLHKLKKKETPKPKPAPKPDDKNVQGTIKVLVNDLWYYDRPDWNAKAGKVNKGEVFTVVGSIKVDGSQMYMLKSGTYITTWHEYVEFKKK